MERQPERGEKGYYIHHMSDEERGRTGGGRQKEINSMTGISEGEAIAVHRNRLEENDAIT